jgi:hypothetical protein
VAESDGCHGDEDEEEGAEATSQECLIAASARLTVQDSTAGVIMQGWRGARCMQG